MKLIILAAWEGSRLRPLTNTTPKPLIKVVWKTIIEHNLEIILSEENKSKFDEIIFVVKYKKEKFIEYFWNSYNWIKINYHSQWEEKWTAAALFWINFEENFILLNWDSIFDKKDLENLINLEW